MTTPTQSALDRVSRSESELPARLVEPHWYAAYTRARHEKRVAQQLERRAVEFFLPQYEAIHRWRNGRHRVHLPLFPGYVFVRIPLLERLRVLEVPSVVRLVGFNGTPEPVSEAEIAGLQAGFSQGLPMEPYPYVTTGKRVRIKSGAFEGQEGVIVRRKGKLRVVLSIQLIQRSILLDADAADLELAPLRLQN